MDTVFKLVLASAGAGAVTSALGSVQNALGSLAAVAATTVASLSGMKGALKLGGDLSDLRLRTGQTVRDLVVMRRAFDNTGVGADNLATLLAYAHKSISGFNEEGGNTIDTFKELGLSLGSLRGMTSMQQLEAFSRAFSKIEDPARRTALAMQLFGRSGASLLVLLRDPTAFQVAQQEVGRLGERMEGNADRFDAVSDKLSIINVRLTEMWVVTAERLLPTLERIVEVMGAMNLSGVGAALPSVMGIIGTVYAGKILGKLDGALKGWAAREGPSIGSTLAKGFEPLRGVLSRLLPIGLAAAIAGQVIAGIIQAYGEAQNQIVAAADAKFDALQGVRQSVEGVRSEEDRQAALKRVVELQLELNDALAKEESRWIKTDATERAIASYQQQLEQTRSLVRLLTTDWAAARMESNRLMDAAAERAARETSAAEWIAGKEGEKAKESIFDAEREAMPLEERLAMEQAQRDFLRWNLQQEKERLLAAGEVNGAKQVELKLQSDLVEVEKTLAKLEQDRARKQTESAQRGLESSLRSLAERRARLEGDFGRREVDKFDERKTLLAEEIRLQEAFLDNINALRATATDDAARATYDSAAQGALDRLSDLRGSQAQTGPDPRSLRQQSLAALTDIENSFQTVQQNIAGTFSNGIRAGIDSAREGMQLLLGDTEFWTQKLGNIAGPVMGAVTAGISKMFTEWIAARALASVKSILFSKAEGAADVAAKAPGATLTSISSFGAAVPIGLAAIAGVLALAKGFNDGGYTGEDGGIVHAREFVFSAPAVRNIGRENLERIHRNARSSTPAASPAANAPASGGGGTSIAFFPSSEEGARWLKTRSGRKRLVEFSSQMRGQIGIDT